MMDDHLAFTTKIMEMAKIHKFTAAVKVLLSVLYCDCPQEMTPTHILHDVCKGFRDRSVISFVEIERNFKLELWLVGLPILKVKDVSRRHK